MESCHQRPYRDAMQTKEQSTDMSTQGTRVASSAGIIGAIIAAMSCTACFPALAVLASALGLGFLSQFESVSIHYVLPLFALIGLAANLVGGRGRGWGAHGYRHRRAFARASCGDANGDLWHGYRMAALSGPSDHDRGRHLGFESDAQ